MQREFKKINKKMKIIKSFIVILFVACFINITFSLKVQNQMKSSSTLQNTAQLSLQARSTAMLMEIEKISAKLQKEMEQYKAEKAAKAVTQQKKDKEVAELLGNDLIAPSDISGKLGDSEEVNDSLANFKLE